MRSVRRWFSLPLYWPLFILLVLAFLFGAVIVLYLVFPPSTINILILGLDHGSSEGGQIKVDTALILRVDPARFTLRSLVVPLESVSGIWDDETPYSLTELAIITDSIPDISAISINNTAIPVQRVAILDYDMFEQLVDEVGGVRIYVERIIEDTDYPDLDSMEQGVKTVRFESGWQILSGERALEYSRMIVAGDLSRAIRQQQILAGWANQLKSPQNWLPVTDILLRHMRTNLTLWDVLVSAPVVLSSQGRIFSATLCNDCVQN